MGYRIVTKKNNYLMHKGKKGMKWGFNDGKRNGKRTADDFDLMSDEEVLKTNVADNEKMSWSDIIALKKRINKISGRSREWKNDTNKHITEYKMHGLRKNFDKDMRWKNGKAKLEAKYAIGKVKAKNAIDGLIRKVKNPMTTKTTHTYLDNSGYTETYNHRTKKKTVKNFKNNKKWKVKKIKPSK